MKVYTGWFELVAAGNRQNERRCSPAKNISCRALNAALVTIPQDCAALQASTVCGLRELSNDAADRGM